MANIKQTLYQKQTPSMMLKPKMLQSLEMLALPMLQLEAHLKAEMINNPMMELKDDDNDESNEKNDEENIEDKELEETIAESEELSEILDSYNEYYSGSSYNKDTDKMEVFEKVLRTKKDKKIAFFDQLDRLDLSDAEYDFAYDLIDSIDDYGFLKKGVNLEDLCVEYGLSLEKVEEIHKQILHFNPAGITARTIEECLLAQLDIDKEDDLTITIVRDYFEDLIHRRYKKIASKLGVTIDTINRIKKRIAMLDPKPGLRIQSNAEQFVVPDLILKNIDGEYEIILNDYSFPKVRLNNNYRKIIKQVKNDKEGVAYLRDKVNSAKFLIKSIYLRGRTLEKVMRSIINHQTEFFYNEIGYLKPLTYSVIADELQVNESTISRVVSSKFADTPFGIMCLKDFFTSKAGKDMKYNAVSRHNVETKIRRMIDEEDSAHPLSDQAIKDHLKELGINVSRRVVAKYRKSKGILNSHLRRKE